MLAMVSSATLLGVHGQPVSVEVHVSGGIPGFTIVGMPDTSVREARDRVRAALLSSELVWPTKRVTVNLAPSALRKCGASLDLAIAVGVMVATGDVSPERIEGVGFVGEVGLDGSIRPIPGALPIVDAMDCAKVVVPWGNVAETAVLERHEVCTASNLSELARILRGEAPWPDLPDTAPDPPIPMPDLRDVRGHPLARLALEVSAAGGHHLLMVGPPGAGKTMLAKRLPSLLGALDTERAIEVTRIHSAAGEPLPKSGLITRPPFRSPHHTSTAPALIGGGSATLRPGEISLAHGGVLFLDELGEFPAFVLDSLRQPLEDGIVRVARVGYSLEFPTDCQVIAAMNPCPCGAGAPIDCRCSDAGLSRYARRVSGPLLDRFDLRIRVQAAEPSDLMALPTGESSEAVAQRVAAARARASDRGVRCNRQLTGAALDEHGPLDRPGKLLLEGALVSGRLTARGLMRVRAIALTLSDLAGGEGVVPAELVHQALLLRSDVLPSGIRMAS